MDVLLYSETPENLRICEGWTKEAGNDTCGSWGRNVCMDEGKKMNGKTKRVEEN